MKTFRRATALVATALLATSLAACSHSNPSNDKESASAQATDSASTGKATQGDQQTTVAAHAGARRLPNGHSPHDQSLLRRPRRLGGADRR